MTNKNTKRALLSSVVAMLLCFTMLLGTTFAWFTDSVTSGRNTIQSGNLDMKLSYKPYGAENTNWTEVKNDTVLFGKDAKYEPGYTEAVWFKVENLGSLAFRYDLAINVEDEKQGTNKAGDKFSLSDYLEVRYLTATSTDMESNFYTTRESLDSFAFGAAANSGVASLADDVAVIKNGVAFAANDPVNGAYSSAYVLVVISMPTTVTNDANHNGTDIPQIDFTLTAVATQLAYESDSFGTGYDKDAEYDDLATANHTCTYDNNDTCTVCGIISYKFDAAAFDSLMGTSTATATNVVIPATFEQGGKVYKVTSLPRSAFHGCTSLESVVIPDSVTSIGAYAFYLCSSLKTVEIPDSVTKIGTAAFSGCSSLESVTIPDGVATIGGNAFLDCSSMTSITIPDSVVSIGNSAFLRCDSLVTVNFKGSEDQWAAIAIDGGNDCLKNATINYNYTGQ